MKYANVPIKTLKIAPLDAIRQGSKWQAEISRRLKLIQNSGQIPTKIILSPDIYFLLIELFLSWNSLRQNRCGNDVIGYGDEEIKDFFESSELEWKNGEKGIPLEIDFSITQLESIEIHSI